MRDESGGRGDFCLASGARMRVKISSVGPCVSCCFVKRDQYTTLKGPLLHPQLYHSNTRHKRLSRSLVTQRTIKPKGGRRAIHVIHTEDKSVQPCPSIIPQTRRRRPRERKEEKRYTRRSRRTAAINAASLPYYCIASHTTPIIKRLLLRCATLQAASPAPHEQ